MNKIVTLCSECAHMLKDGYKVIPLPRAANQKVTCGNCGRRRYGGEFRIEKGATS